MKGGTYMNFFKYNDTITQADYQRYTSFADLLELTMVNNNISISDLIETSGCDRSTVRGILRRDTKSPSLKTVTTLLQAVGLVTKESTSFHNKLQLEPKELLHATGICPSHVRNFRNGVCSPSWELLLKICVALDEDPVTYLNY